MIIHRHRQILFGIVLTYHILVKELTYLHRCRELPDRFRILFGPFRSFGMGWHISSFGEIILKQPFNLSYTVAAYIRITQWTWHKDISIGRLLSAERALHSRRSYAAVTIVVTTFLCHYFFSGRSTLSIIPYSLASWAVIQ